MREKDPAKLESIFNATLRMVLKEGFTALKMSEVAKEAGVATGTLYVYFENKETLVQHLYAEIQKRTAANFTKAYDTKAPFAVAFEKVWRNYISIQMQQPEIVAFVEQYQRSPFMNSVENEAHATTHPFFSLLERGKAERLIRDIPVELLVIQLTGAIAELVSWHYAGRIKATPSIINKAFDLAWDSIRR